MAAGREHGVEAGGNVGAAGVEGCLVAYSGKKEVAGQGKYWGKCLCEWEDGEVKEERIAPEIMKKMFLKFLSQQNPWNEDAAVYLKKGGDLRFNAM